VESAAAVKALQNDAVVTSCVKRTAATATANPAVFGVVEEYRA
jgi:hypothetical protein